MSVYFIHAEVSLRNGIVVENISMIISAHDANSAHELFWLSDMVTGIQKGLIVVIDKFERVE
nr:MAG TPA: hypothetical protein [Caudoviricetes sp.]